MFIPLNPLQLPSVPLADRKRLPSCTAIYFAIDEQDRILYIGKAKNLASRWENHHRLYALKEIDKEISVRLAWQVWNEEDLDEAEKSLIVKFQPLLNNTRVEAPTVVPSETILRDFLKTFSRRLIIFGIKPGTSESLPTVHLKYDWTDASSKGTAIKLKEYVARRRDDNTSLRFKHRKFSKFHSFAGEVFRPGSRAQKTRARQHRAFNNQWEIACNGVIVHIMPVHSYREYKKQTHSVKFAGINCCAITPEAFLEAQRQNDYDFLGLSCYVADPVLLVWGA